MPKERSLRSFVKGPFLATLMIWLAFLSLPAHAQSLSLLRDAETERFFRDVTDPILEAAELDPASVDMYLINNNSINAFVAGGQNIFVFTGLILASDNSDEFLGVMAHETCHIACNHLLRRREAASKSAPIQIASLVLGALAIAAGGGDAGLGLIMAGQSVAQGQFLAYTRSQEGEADLAGARYLKEVGYSADGLIAFFEKLRQQELFARIRQNPYVRSHPLNRTRILNLQRAASLNPRHGLGPIPEIEERYQRIKAKLGGYLSGPQATLNQYPLSDTSIPARYARVYAWHKAKEWDRAIEEADALILAEPGNPYFREIKGQILFEAGKIDESLPVFRNAVQLSPAEPLILTALGQALIASEDQPALSEAVPLLKRATILDRENTFAWFNLARAYGYQGLEAEANLATAERYAAQGRGGPAVGHARRAMQGFEPGSPQWIRAQDILVQAEDLIRQAQRNSRRRFQPGFNPGIQNFAPYAVPLLEELSSLEPESMTGLKDGDGVTIADSVENDQ